VPSGVSFRQYRRALRYVLPHWRGLVLVLVLGLLSTAMALAQPCISGKLIDCALLRHNMRALEEMLFMTPFEEFERSTGPHVERWRLRPGERHSGHYRKPLATRLSLRIQTPPRATRSHRAGTTIANSDSDGHAYTNIAIDQAHRAVQEPFLLTKRLPRAPDKISTSNKTGDHGLDVFSNMTAAIV
jgi:ABC-type multidrug transport system fused ATPase/permease subunit